MFPWRNVGVRIFQTTSLGCLGTLEFHMEHPSLWEPCWRSRWL